jgi:predicted amidophosphoribosyltransferase
MLSDLHVMGSYWCDGVDEPSSLGSLVASAKDFGSGQALAELQELLAEFSANLDLPRDTVVVAVPPGPRRGAHPVPALATCVAAAIDAQEGVVLGRRYETARLRDAPPEQRRDLVEAAGYEVISDVRGRRVVLVDDVILTGTTLQYLSGLLVEAGAARVDAVVACRTRRA